jgi:hypothetical protein
MSIKNGMITGAAVGTGIALVMIALDHLRPFSIPVSDFIGRAIFRVCPLYILGFSNSVTNKPTWFLITILGNAVLYGMVGGIIGLFFRRGQNQTINPGEKGDSLN